MKKLYIFTLMIFSVSLAFAQGGTGVNAQIAEKPVSSGLRYSGNVETIPIARGRGNNHGNGHQHHFPGNGYQGIPILHCDMLNSILWDMDNTNCQETRLRIAKETARNYSMTSNQVYRIAKKLRYESNRLDFLFYAFNAANDPENYWQVSDALAYESSKAELGRFLMNQGIQPYGAGASCSSGFGGSGSAYNGSYGSNGYYTDPVPAPAIPPSGFCGACSGMYAPNHVCINDFSRIMESIARQTFESDKLAIARQATRGRLLSSGQVRQLMLLFTFESTRLNFAKFAWDNLVLDPENFYLVNDAFDFSSSIRNLDEYINR